MNAPCCVGVVRDADGLVGKEITVGKTLKAYYASPKVKSGKRMGIVVVHDIFGYPLANCKYIVDYLASKGFDAVLPDFYADKEDVDPSAWPANESEVLKPLEGDEFGKWFGNITSEKFMTRFKEEVEDTTAFLRRKGCIRFGIIGFCWGGLAAETAAKSGRFAASVSAHGCMHTAESYKEVKGSMLYISVSGDAFFSKEAQDSITTAGGKVKVYDGLHHGFVVRGDFANDGKVKAAADEAMASAEALFSAACLRKPKYSKVGSLHPNASGVTLMVKIIGEAKEVEEQKRGGGSAKFYEVAVGDETGNVLLSLKDFQTEGMEKDKVICVRNASVRMIKGFIRLVVDKWGKLDKEVEGTIEQIGEKNMSTTEYELVPA